jgi:hypothetical protein
MVKEVKPKEDAFPSLLKAHDQIKILRRDMGETDHFNSFEIKDRKKVLK